MTATETPPQPHAAAWQRRIDKELGRVRELLASPGLSNASRERLQLAQNTLCWLLSEPDGGGLPSPSELAMDTPAG